MSRHCFAPGCDTGYQSATRRNKASGKKNPSLFRAPKDSQLLKKWQIAIRRKDKIFNTTDKLCELHFEDECIERAYETRLPDGSVFILDRGRVLLKPGSVPTLFPHLPKCLSTKRNKRKSPTLHNTQPDKKKRLNVNVYDDNNSHIKSQQQSNNYAEFLYCVKDIQVPDSWWSVALIQDYVMCAKWNSEFSCEWRVVVCKDFSVKIFLRSKEISLDAEVYSAESLSSLLQRINDLIICEDIESGLSVSCRGYLTKSKKQTRCDICRNLRKKQNGLERRKEIQVVARK